MTIRYILITEEGIKGNPEPPPPSGFHKEENQWSAAHQKWNDSCVLFEDQNEIIFKLPASAWKGVATIVDAGRFKGRYGNSPKLKIGTILEISHLECEVIWQVDSKLHPIGWGVFKGPDWIVQHEQMLNNAQYQYRRVLRIK